MYMLFIVTAVARYLLDYMIIMFHRAIYLKIASPTSAFGVWLKFCGYETGMLTTFDTKGFMALTSLNPTFTMYACYSYQ